MSHCTMKGWTLGLRNEAPSERCRQQTLSAPGCQAPPVPREGPTQRCPTFQGEELRHKPQLLLELGLKPKGRTTESLLLMARCTGWQGQWRDVIVMSQKLIARVQKVSGKMDSLMSKRRLSL